MKILSKREIVKAEKTEQKYFFDIVFEWEDIFSEILEVDIETRSKLEYKFDEVTRKIYKKGIFLIIVEIVNCTWNILMVIIYSVLTLHSHIKHKSTGSSLKINNAK